MTSMFERRGWVVVGAVATLHLAGCECDDETPLQPAVVVPAPAPEPVREALVHATRSGLPESAPAITVTVDGDHFVVSNAALVETWPAAERTRVAQARPETAPATWPTVEREGTLPSTPGYRAPEVEAALTLARDVEVARSQSGAPNSYALRVQPETPWSNVIRVMFSSGLANFNEPRLVLARGGGEVELRLPLPATGDIDVAPVAARIATLPPSLTGRDPREVANAIREALAAHPPAGARALGPEAQVPEAPPPVFLMLSDAGLNVMRAGERLAPGCEHTAIGHEPTIATAQLNLEAITQCLTHAGPSPQGYVLSADGALSYARVIAVAEAASGVGRLAFGAGAQ